MRTLHLHFTFPADAYSYGLYADTTGHQIVDATVDGAPLPGGKLLTPNFAPWGWGYGYAGPPPAGSDLVLNVRGNGPLRIMVTTVIASLPPDIGAPALPSDLSLPRFPEVGGQTSSSTPTGSEAMLPSPDSAPSAAVASFAQQRRVHSARRIRRAAESARRRTCPWPPGCREPSTSTPSRGDPGTGGPAPGAAVPLCAASGRGAAAPGGTRRTGDTADHPQPDARRRRRPDGRPRGGEGGDRRSVRRPRLAVAAGGAHPRQPPMVYLSFDHTVADGYSTKVAFQELEALYRALVDGRPADLPPTGDYVAYSADERHRYADGAELDRSVDEVRSLLRGRPIEPEFPLPVTDWDVARGRYAYPDLVDGEAAGRLADYCRAQRVSPYMVILAAFGVAARESRAAPRWESSPPCTTATPATPARVASDGTRTCCRSTSPPSRSSGSTRASRRCATG